MLTEALRSRILEYRETKNMFSVIGHLTEMKIIYCFATFCAVGWEVCPELCVGQEEM
jgi:hypothetical protein